LVFPLYPKKDIKISEMKLLSSSIPDFDVVTSEQLKQLACKLGVKVKGTAKEDMSLYSRKIGHFPFLGTHGTRAGTHEISLYAKLRFSPNLMPS
jgi:hypothetical protein